MNRKFVVGRIDLFVATRRSKTFQEPAYLICSILCATSCVRQERSAMDPVATVEKIVKIGLKIKDAVDKARHNGDECREIRKRVLRFSEILSQLQQTGTVADSPAMAGVLEDLEETLQRALDGRRWNLEETLIFYVCSLPK